MHTRRIPAPAATLVALLALLVAAPALAQETLERTTNLTGGWIGPTGLLHLSLPYRLHAAPAARGLTGVPTFDLGLGTPGSALIGVRFAPGSPTAAGRPDEWEAYGRIQPLAGARGGAFDLAGGGAFNHAARSIDGELSLAGWLGPARLLAAGRALGNAYDGGDARFAIAAGAVVHPLPRRAPLAVAADLGTLLDRRAGERAAWSAALQLGISHTTHTLSLFATNTATSTLQGVSRGEARTRYGVELTAPIPVGRFLGWYVPRAAAREAVRVDVAPAAGMVRAEVRDFLYFPRRIVVRPGTVVEWTNRDEAVHTVTATDRAWDSGAIQPGASWRARFDEPGRYPFLCGPHPFMQGVVIVRGGARAREPEPEAPDTAYAAGDYRVYTGAGAPATLADVVAAMERHDVVFLGETHDDPTAHMLQAELLRQARERYTGVALAAEFFERDVQLVLDEYLTGLISEAAFLAASRPWPRYATDYRPLVEFAREHGLPVIAANAPRRYVTRVTRHGREALAALSPAALAHLPPLPYGHPSPAYREQWIQVIAGVMRQEGLKCGIPVDDPPAPVGAHGDMGNQLHAQALWDATMAWSLARHLEAHPGALILHVVGGFHVARGTGTPEHLAAYRPAARAMVVLIRPVADVAAFEPAPAGEWGDFVIQTERARTLQEIECRVFRAERGVG
jgi:uncharacterized iron-regulated protein/plastocyanin